MPACIKFETEQAIARVTLSYPERFNAMSRAMWRELKAIFEQIQASAEIRCVCVAGQGGHFCAGGDISEYPSFRFERERLRDFHENQVWSALDAMLRCDVPVVAQIAGNCMGAGVEIASCCDIRLSAESAQFGAPIAKLGFPMAPRELALVGRELGLTTARQMLLEAAVFSAPELLQRGFLSRVVADVDLATMAQATLQRIAALAPRAARLNKQSIRVLNQSPVLINQALTAMNNDIRMDSSEASLRDLLAHAYDYADGAEQREGIAAFLQKRPPQF